jgi:hypothetical protein
MFDAEMVTLRVWNAGMLHKETSDEGPHSSNWKRLGDTAQICANGAGSAVLRIEQRTARSLGNDMCDLTHPAVFNFIWVKRNDEWQTNIATTTRISAATT